LRKGESDMHFSRIANVLTLIYVGLVVLHCNNPAAGNKQTIVGKWLWKETSGGMAGQTFLPPPALIVEFKSFDTCSFYKTDTLISSGLYSSYSKDSILFTDITPDSANNYMGIPRSGKKSYEISNDTLMINDIGNDGYEYLYTRE
jgi:hypothetical protein